MMRTLRSVLTHAAHSTRCSAVELAGESELHRRHRRVPAPPPAVERLGREAVADAEVRVDVPPLRRGALELLAQLADEHVDRAVAVRHRVAPHALVDLLALSTWPAAPASRRISSNSRRVRSRLRRRRTPGTGRRGSTARRLRAPGARPAASARSAAGARRLDARDQLLGVAGLRQPVVGAEPQRAHALGDGRASGADDRGSAGSARADPLEVGPARRAEHGQVDHERAEPQRDELLDRHGARKHALLPAARADALVEHVEEAAVAVDHGEAEGSGPRSLGVGLAEWAIRSHAVLLYIVPGSLTGGCDAATLPPASVTGGSQPLRRLRLFARTASTSESRIAISRA